jgi:5S rRNA maturation endonuclease (ribonuclease M5)
MKYEDFISRFEKKRKTQTGFMLVCPSHDDSPKTPSLHASPARDGGVLVKCFAGCTSENVMSALGLTMKDLFAAERSKQFTPPAVRQTVKESPDVKPEIETIYSYEDINGGELYQAIRMKPKSFRQRHKVEGQWVWNMDGVERVLYRLPQITKSESVWICEGEKDVNNLVALGFEATCNVGGAGKWLDSYSELLTGKDVVICGDNDEAGEKHVKLVFDSLAEAARSVRIVKLPKTVKDASDYIAAFKTHNEAKAALLDLHGMAHPHVKGHHLPVYSISEIENDYRRFVRSMGENAFSLGKWLPTLGMNLRSLVPGELVFIIGDTGTGKTGILQQISRAALPLPTLMFELELPKEMMFERYASMITNMTGEQIEQAYQSCDDSFKGKIDIKLKNLCICPVSRLSVRQIEEIIMRSELKLGERPKVVLIDYIQLVKGEGETRRGKISDISEELKVMAKATRTIIIVASQIARPKEVDEKWEPSLHSAKESGSIEASCGLLISAWQDLKDSSALNIRVLKSTKGGTGTFVKCNFDGARMIITERAKQAVDDQDIPTGHND